MKITEKAKKQKVKGVGLSKAAVNEHSKTWILILLIIIVVASIITVMKVGKKAEQTVSIVMLKDGAYKNEVITEDMLVEYPMVQLEYEKYSTVDKNGTKENRFFLWSERKDAINKFAAYPIPNETALERRSLTTQKVDNSDTVLYTFPGKDIIQLNIGGSDLNAFKTFLQPGDKLNIEAIYSDKVSIEKDDGYGNIVKEDVEVFRTDTVFGNIMIADLINSSGDSILDIYSEYNDKTLYDQAQLDNSSAFQESVTPASLLVALTPQEKELYYKYCAKDNVQFKVSLPQRTQ